MHRIVVASTRQGAGKTSVILGLARALKKEIGYMKPFGDRLLYRKKRLWDFDSSLVTDVLGLHEDPEDMSLGFEHSKLRYIYGEQETRDKLRELASYAGTDKELLFVEGGRDLVYGISVHLDPMTVAADLEADLMVVVSGNEDSIMDDLTFVKSYVMTSDVRFQGVIINKVHDIEDFQNTYQSEIADMGIGVLGILPYQEDLTHFSMKYLADRLFAKVVAGEGGLDNVVKNIFVGAMTTDAVLRFPPFQKEAKLIITSGDRCDMILAALESNTAGFIITNNILPPPNILSMASERRIPLLLMNEDTFKVAKRVDDLDMLIFRDDTAKIELLEKMVRDHLNLEAVLNP